MSLFFMGLEPKPSSCMLKKVTINLIIIGFKPTTIELYV